MSPPTTATLVQMWVSGLLAPRSLWVADAGHPAVYTTSPPRTFQCHLTPPALACI